MEQTTLDPAPPPMGGGPRLLQLNDDMAVRVNGDLGHDAEQS
jgi:hypothetical protein